MTKKTTPATSKRAPAKKASKELQAKKPKHESTLELDKETKDQLEAQAAQLKKPAKKLKPIEDYLADMADEQGEEIGEGGKIRAILMLWIKGYSRKDIIAAGFNKSTVYRQVGEYEKLKKAPAISYQGYQIFEGRVQAIMSAKKCSREKALQIIQQKDLS